MAWPFATRCRPRPMAIRSSSASCCGTWPRHRPSIRTSASVGPQLGLARPGLPVSIREVIGRRVACRARQLRSAVAAAVIGRDFDAAVLARGRGSTRTRLIDLCDRAVTRGVAHRSRQGGVVHVRSRAHRARALRQHLSAARRVRAHQTVAEVLHANCPVTILPRGSESSPTTGRHANQRQNADKAIHYAERAGDQALEQLRPMRHCVGSGRHSCCSTGPASEDPRRRATLLLGLGEAQRQTGDAEHRATLLAAGPSRRRDRRDPSPARGRAAEQPRLEQHGWRDRSRTRRPAHPSADPGRATKTAPIAGACWRCCASSGSGTADFDERLSMATQAVDMARPTGDKAGPGRSGSAQPRGDHDARHPRAPPAREHRGLCPSRRSSGDPTARSTERGQDADTPLEEGDVATMLEAQAAIFESECDRIGQPLNRWQIVNHGALPTDARGRARASPSSRPPTRLALGTVAGFPEDAITFYRQSADGGCAGCRDACNEMTS